MYTPVAFLCLLSLSLSVGSARASPEGDGLIEYGTLVERDDPCATYYTVVSGDTCSSIATKYSFSLDTFYSLNSGINRDCTNMLADSQVCIASKPKSDRPAPKNDPGPPPPPPPPTSGPYDNWDDIKGLAGAVRYCTDKGLQGSCQSWLPKTDPAECTLLPKSYFWTISSLQIGPGGQCCFWLDQNCKTSPTNFLDTGSEGKPASLTFDVNGKYDDFFGSFKCWAHKGKPEC